MDSASKLDHIALICASFNDTEYSFTSTQGPLFLHKNVYVKILFVNIEGHEQNEVFLGLHMLKNTNIVKQ